MRLALLPVLIATACAGTPVDDTPDGDTDTDTSPPTLCDTLGLPSQAFVTEGPFGILRGSVAEDFEVKTTDGPWRLSEHWSGCDIYVFVPEEDASSGAFPQSIWSRDQRELLKASPDNVHWFFFTTASDAADRAKALEATFDNVLADMNAANQAWWPERLHFIKQPIGEVDGWLSDKFAATGYGFVIDRAQQVRDIGSLADPDRYDGGVGWFGPNMSMAANEAVYANFVAQRQARLDAEQDDVTVVRMLDAEATGGATRDITLPDEATMAGFDTLELDITQLCGGDREFGTCPAWDYLAYLDLCAVPAVEPNPRTDTACQPYVAAVTTQAEVMGSCHADGTDLGEPCMDVAPCELLELPVDSDTDAGPVTLTCEGYLPEVLGIEGMAADTAACDCTGPDGTTTEATQTCRGDGTGFGDCPCACEEVGRWITTYHREGRWVFDATHALARLQTGGSKRLRYRGGNSYISTVDLRLSSRSKGVGTPSKRIPLFTGGAFNASYNDRYTPITVDIPATATRVELVAITSGHGFGKDRANCAEFCNHTHHFTVGSDTFVQEHPQADEPLGCVDQVAEGTVPNQFGTWFFGRGGWCPGKEVAPWVADVTASVTPGSTVTITYEGRLAGETYVPIPATGDGFGARIDLNSWLVIWE